MITSLAFALKRLCGDFRFSFIEKAFALLFSISEKPVCRLRQIVKFGKIEFSRRETFVLCFKLFCFSF